MIEIVAWLYYNKDPVPDSRLLKTCKLQTMTQERAHSNLIPRLNWFQKPMAKYSNITTPEVFGSWKSSVCQYIMSSYIYIHISHTCIIKQPLNFGRFGFLPVSENNGNSARFGPFLPDLKFFCHVRFPSLLPHHIKLPNLQQFLPVKIQTHKKQVVTWTWQPWTSSDVILVLPTPPASVTGPCQRKSS